MSRSAPVQQAVRELPGYSLDRCGEVCSVDELFDESRHG